MIKLNNKNITYIALADSNNSIKAPKEIWYADSSNSVKLVYRRKDALIEGEDYEKYHWLKTGSGNPYIEVANDYNTDNAAYLETTFKGASVNYDRDIIIGLGSNNSFGYRIFNYNNLIYIDIHKRIDGILASKRLSFNTSPYEIIHMVINSNSYEVNNFSGTYQLGSGFDKINQKETRIATNTVNNDMHYAETKLRVNNVEYDLIPGKLLKPVPKWLDANGIRRQVGECGMIDLVSGKFYGNVNSVGTFTVENYYERKEWLKVQTTTQTGTYLKLPLASMNFSFKRVWLSNFLNTWYFSTPGYVYYTDNHRLICIWDAANSTIVDSGDTSTIDVGDIITIESTPDLLLMNGKTINRYNYVSGMVSLTYVVALKITSLTSSVTVDGVERYIPCTLTMDLPASMDANNIARTKGTSGMWDLVSDRFYGNVANSGTFKAVNLAEGVDYEVHQWLVANIPIGVAMMSLPINSSTFNCTIEHTGARANLPHLYSNGYIYFTESSNMDTIRVWDVNEANNPFSASVGSLMTIESNEEYFKVNNISITKYGFPILRTVIQSSYNSNNASTTKTSSITVDGIERYIPVKLLRSIPSKYDANGIARQAGECGMYDTVNDVFYGNVASSGTFSVSDD